MIIRAGGNMKTLRVSVLLAGRLSLLLGGILLAVSAPLPWYKVASTWARVPGETDFSCWMVTHHCGSWYITGFEFGLGSFVVGCGGILLLSALIDQGGLGMGLVWLAVAISVLCLGGSEIVGPVMSDVSVSTGYGFQILRLGALLGIIGGLPRVFIKAKVAAVTS
jgi:hypothetical protein